MVEIIKRGPNVMAQHHFKCKMCSSEWLADAKDYSRYQDSNKSYVYIMCCPICGYRVYQEEDKSI